MNNDLILEITFFLIFNTLVFFSLKKHKDLDRMELNPKKKIKT